MKYYIRTANLEPPMNQPLSKIDFVAKRCKTTILCKKSNIRFLPIHRNSKYPTFAFSGTSKIGKFLLVSFAIVNLTLGCLEFKYLKKFSALVSFLNMQKISSK